MSSLFGIGAGSASTGFYPETIDQSLRFEDGDSPRLSKTFGSGGDRKNWTWSAWIKRGNISSTQILFHTFAQGGFGIEGFIALLSDDTISFQFDYNGGSHIRLITNRVFRDTTNFFHLCCVADSDNSTQGDRIRMYINGVRETSFSSENYPTNTTTDGSLNSTYNHYISGRTNNSSFFDGYLAEVNFLDGVAVTDTSGILNELVEIKNGVCIPKEYSGSYGTTGFRFTFADSSSLGDDTSGNANDFASSGLASTDVVTDTPTNNFATLNSIGNNNQATFSEGNLKISFPQDINAQPRCQGTFAVSSGKWYWEVNVISITTASTPMIGIKDLTVSGHESQIFSGSSVYAYYGNSGNKYNSGNLGSYGATYTAGDIIGVALDLDAGTLTFYKNNSSQGTAFSSLSGEYTLHLGTGYYAWVGVVNFGQDGTFAGNETAQGNSDENGIGDFYYSPPSGHLALCSSNLPDTTLSPNQDTQADDHFNTILWTGTGTGADAKSVGFQTDWLWAKDRQNANGHVLIDSSRGVTKYLSSNASTVDTTDSNIVQSFDTDGFTTVGQGINYSSVNYVGWNWKAGGTTPTKTYKVVVVSDSGNKYRFRNSADSATFAQSAVTLDLQEGGTYVFDWSDSSAQGHPIRFSTTSDGTHGGGSAYTSGVVNDDSNYKTTITVPSSAPTLYYYCSNHSGMGGQINTNTTFGQTNFDGSILSVQQQSTDAGFSIVTYTGTGSNATVGHGLGVAPSMVIVKNRNTSSYGWFVWHTAFGTAGNTDYINLNLSDQKGSGGSVAIWNSTVPTSSVFSLGTYGGVNGNTNTYVAYCFAEIEGYSKFGSYIGNGSTDGTFVYTGFRPAWLMLKRTDASGLWLLFDNKRNGFNPDNRELIPDSNSSEQDYDRLDLVSNGFKHRTSFSGNNGNGFTYIYMAFGDGNTAKFGNSR